MKFHALAGATSCLLAVLAGAAQAQQAAPAPSPAQPAVDAQSALRVVRDKATGQLRNATADEARAMAAAEAAAPATAGMAVAPSVRTYSNGMRAAVLSPDFLSSLKAVRRADGSLDVHHAERHHDDTAAPAAPALPTE